MSTRDAERCEHEDDDCNLSKAHPVRLGPSSKLYKERPGGRGSGLVVGLVLEPVPGSALAAAGFTRAALRRPVTAISRPASSPLSRGVCIFWSIRSLQARRTLGLRTGVPVRRRIRSAAEVDEGSVGPMMAETADASLRSDEPQDRGAETGAREAVSSERAPWRSRDRSDAAEGPEMQLRRRRMDHHARPGPLHGSGHCGRWCGSRVVSASTMHLAPPARAGPVQSRERGGALTEQFPRPVDSRRNAPVPAEGA